MRESMLALAAPERRDLGHGELRDQPQRLREHRDSESTESYL
jgi:hypothetical protein